MLLPLYTDRPLRRTPYVNLGLIGANLAMFAVQGASPLVEAALILRPHEPSPLTLLGSAFMHGGILHLAGNLLFLYIFGNSVNDKLGHVAYLGLYLGGAVAAGLAHVAVEDNPALGASGAVWAVSGAFMAMFPRSRITVLFFFFIITWFQVPAVLLIGVFFLLDVFRGVGGLFGGETAIAHWAHVGGAVYGFGIALGLSGLRLVPREHGDLVSQWRRRRLRKEHRAAVVTTGPGGGTFDIPRESEHDRMVARLQAVRTRINDAFDREDLSAASAAYAELVAADPRQVLDRHRQLDVANQAVRDARHADAAVAYEAYLARYAAAGDAEDARTRLMLALVYTRYLSDPEKARTHLEAALPDLTGDEKELAGQELEKVRPADLHA